jgi:hypothetical protein
MKTTLWQQQAGRGTTTNNKKYGRVKEGRTTGCKEGEREGAAALVSSIQYPV